MFLSKLDSLNNALKLIDENQKLMGSEEIPLDEAHKRVLAENIIAYQGRESIVLLLICLILFCIDVMFIFRFVQFHLNSRSVRDIYDEQLRKILSNYHSYIQKISNEFEFTGYQVLYVDQFTDLLEIRETISEPILMTSDPHNKATFFIVPSNTKILWIIVI